MKSPKIQTDLVHIAQALNLFRLGSNIAGIFIPFIILQGGGKLWTIGLFYLVYAVIKLAINYPLMRLIQRRGAHFGLGFGFVLSGFQMVSILGYAQFHSIAFLLIAATFLAFTNGFVWNAQHYFISKYMDSATKSSSIATIEIYGRLFDIIGPILGGLVGAVFGPIWLLVAALVCIAATAWPLRRMGNLTIVQEDSGNLGYHLRGAPKRDLIANFCFNIESSIGSMAWPIYLAVVLASFKSIGSVGAIAAVASIITTWIAGHRGDRGKDRAVLREGVVASSVIHVLRIILTTPIGITVISAAYKSSLAYLMNSWTSTYYQHAQDKGSQYIISMEIACDLAYVALWGLFLTLALVIHDTRLLFNIVFIVAAVAAWGCLLITRQKSDKTLL
ncbi:hypothetical protein BH09PAT3_BH09PAT3_0340 [soil metagenome]